MAIRGFSVHRARLCALLLACTPWQLSFGQSVDWTAREKEIVADKTEKYRISADTIIPAQLKIVRDTTQEIVGLWGKVKDLPTPAQSRAISDARFKQLNAVSSLYAWIELLDPSDKKQAQTIANANGAVNSAKDAIIAAKTQALQAGLTRGGSDPNIVYSDANPADPAFLDKARAAVKTMVAEDANAYDEKRKYEKKEAEKTRAQILVEAKNQISSEKLRADAGKRETTDRGTEGGPTPKGLQWITAKRIGGNEMKHPVSLDPAAVLGGTFAGKGVAICRTKVDGTGWLAGWTYLGDTGAEGCMVRVGSAKNLLKDFDVLIPAGAGSLPALTWQSVDITKNQKVPAGAVAIGKLADGTVPILCRAVVPLTPAVAPNARFIGHINATTGRCEFASRSGPAVNNAFEVLVDAATTTSPQAAQSVTVPQPTPPQPAPPSAKPAARPSIKILQASPKEWTGACNQRDTGGQRVILAYGRSCDGKESCTASADITPDCVTSFQVTYECFAGKSQTAVAARAQGMMTMQISCK